ncbi:hypothetical protein IPA_03335 [Ignicoccus pacificus DSM 13166]|uniref:Uncharacterized protein n=1 Tax=Ignicoccus pacificus DSM 13166 TaxID=940294 RepID=A0A977KAY3_9CREN|nr:hypothetical protein IPA_03335 [Ignicoccus pacificus DSM 13166]
MISEDTVLKVIMEDAGCERMDKECLENILELVKEGKYPRLSTEELRELDEGLANLVSKVGLRDRELAEKATNLGMEKTAQALQFGLLEEEEEKEEAPGEIPMARKKAPPRETHVSYQPMTQRAEVMHPVTQIKIKQSKAPLVLSIIAILLSLGTLAVMMGYLTLPGVKVPSVKTIEQMSTKINSLEAMVKNLDNRLLSNVATINRKLNKLNAKIDAIQANVTKLNAYVNAQLNLLNERLDNLQMNLARTRSIAINNKAEIETLSEKIVNLKTTMQEEIKSLRKQLTSMISEYQANVTAKLEQLNKEYEALNEELLTLKKELNSYATKDDVKSLESKVEQLNATVSKIRLTLAKLVALNTTVQVLEDQLSKMSAEIYALKTQVEKIAQLENELNKLNEELTMLNAQVRANMTEINLKVKEYLNEVNAKIEELNAQLAMLKKDLKRLDEQVKELPQLVNMQIEKALNNEQVINSLAHKLLTKAKLDKMVAKMLLSNGTAFYDLVKRIAEEVYINFTVNPQTNLVQVNG